MCDSPDPVVTWAADGVALAVDSDQPNHLLAQGPDEMFFGIADTFSTYLMYQPPGSGSVYVPLTETDWYFVCSVARPAGGVWIPSLGTSHLASFVEPAFPEWSSFSGADHSYVPAPPW